MQKAATKPGSAGFSLLLLMKASLVAPGTGSQGNTETVLSQSGDFSALGTGDPGTSHQQGLHSAHAFALLPMPGWLGPSWDRKALTEEEGESQHQAIPQGPSSPPSLQACVCHN